ncbi:MAG: MFS transporter [Dermatophilaceae bacterium]
MEGSSAALSPLRDPAFRWFFAARLISTAGSAMAPVALVFAVLHVTSSPAALGQVLAARSIPLVLLLLVGGVVADRFPRSRVLIVSHLGSALTQGAAACLVITGQAELWQLIVLEACNGAVTAFTMPAILGVVPQLVARCHLQQANALLAFTRGGLAVLGPTSAALLVVTVGPGWALLVDALTWVVAAACIMPIRLPAPAAPEESHSLLSQLRSGWDVFVGATWLWVVVVACGILMAIHAGAWSTLGPVAALQLPQVGERGWGLALSAEAVGLLVFTLVMLRARVVHPLRWGIPAMMLLALPLFALGAGASLGVLVVAAFLAGAGVQVFMITWQTAIHEHIPERYLSRVSAYDSVGSFVGIPVGQLAVGPLAAGEQVRGVIWWSGWVFILVLACTLAVPAVRALRRPEVDFSPGPDSIPQPEATPPDESPPGTDAPGGHPRRRRHDGRGARDRGGQPVNPQAQRPGSAPEHGRTRGRGGEHSPRTS